MHFTVLDVPGDTKTIAYGINDADVIVGAFLDNSEGHAFLATDPPAVPLPSTLLLLGSGLLGLAGWRRKS
jgi:hypothetical protein